MKKIIALLLSAAMLGVCFVGCKGDDKDKDNEKGEVSKSDVVSTIDMSNVKLIKDGTLSVGMEIGYPPFENKAEDGSPVGYDVDLIYAIGEKLGVEINLIDTAFDVIFAGIDTNYDCVVSAVTIDDERKKNCLFSEPYVDNYQAVVVKKGSDLKVESLNDLSNHTVTLQKGTTSEKLLKNLIDTNTVTDCTMSATEQILTCFTALANGEYDFVLCDSTVADGYVAREPDKYEIVYVDASNLEQFGIAMGKENVELQKVINEAMDQLREEGFFEENYSTWFKR